MKRVLLVASWLLYHSSSELYFSLLPLDVSSIAHLLNCALLPLQSSLTQLLNYILSVTIWPILYLSSSKLQTLTTSTSLSFCNAFSLLPLDLSSITHPLNCILSVVTWPTLYRHSSSEFHTSVATWPLHLSLGVSSAFSSYSRISAICLLSIGLPRYQWCSTSITYNVWTKYSVAKSSSILDAPSGSSQNLKGNRILKLVMKRKRWLLGVEESCIFLLFQGSLWSVKSRLDSRAINKTPLQ